MDSRISNPMGLSLEHHENEAPSTTVTIHTEPSPPDNNSTSSNTASNTNSAANDWLQSLTANGSLQITASQLNELEVVANATPTSETPPPSVIGVQGGDWMSAINGARYHNNGKYIIGYVNNSTELHHLLQEYIKLTGTSFPQIQQLNLTTKQSEDDYLQQRFLTPSARPRLFWQMHAGEPIIHFDGVPFITVGHCTDVPCILAGRRRTTTQLLVATGDVLPTKIQTQGCSAKISIRRILRYPSGRLPDTGAQGITAMRRLRKQALEVLTAKICAGLVKPVERFYFSLPTPLAHDTHIAPEIEDPPSLIENVHEEIIRQINLSITSVGVISDHIHKYVAKNFGDNPSLNIQEPTFSPSRYDLLRYIYWLYKSGRVLDQDFPFKERYTLSCNTEEFSPSTCTTNNDKTFTTQSVEEDTLANMYGMAVNDSGELAPPLDLAPPHVGAEEVTGTDTSPPVTMVTKPATPSNSRQRKSSGLLAVPRSELFDNNNQEYSSVDYDSVQQSQEEVQSILTIIQNQTHACHDLNALQTLRRQLTLLCTEFSVHLAGQKRSHPSPLISEGNAKRQHL